MGQREKNEDSRKMYRRPKEYCNQENVESRINYKWVGIRTKKKNARPEVELKLFVCKAKKIIGDKLEVKVTRSKFPRKSSIVRDSKMKRRCYHKELSEAKCLAVGGKLF